MRNKLFDFRWQCRTVCEDLLRRAGPLAVVMRSSALFLIAALALGLAAAPAQAAYVQVYSTIQKGALTFTGNTLELNGTSGASGTPGTAGTGGAFIAVGSAGNCGTFPAGTTCTWPNDASSAVLNIPTGATVLYAELIWSGTIGSLTAGQLNTPITFTTASGGIYTVTPSSTTAATSGTYYTRSANVTGFVQSARSGTYTAAGVPAGSTAGTTDAAGWTLAVAYADPSKPARNLTIFVGAEQAGAAPAAVSGFCTPVSGPVNGRLLISAIEGDATITGDTMLFGPTSNLAGNTMSGPNNLANNFFASQINGDNGTLDTSGTFGNVNSAPPTGVSAARQGWDITNIDASARLTNSQTSAYAQGTTTGDNYAISALAMQINVTSPVFPVTVKSVNKTATFVGDTLRYAINLDNTAGNGAANNVTFYDTIPAGMALVSNSVMVNGTLQPGADPGAGIAVGNISAGSVITVSFDATVVTLPASPAPAKFDNSARWTYTYVACAGVLTLPGSVTTNAVSTPAPRLEPVKTVSPSTQLTAGQVATYTISMPNTGLVDTAGTTLADPIPAGTTYVAGSTTLNGVAVPDNAGAMPFASAAAVNSPGKAAGVIAQGASANVQFQVTAQGGGAVSNVASIDPDGTGPAPPITVSAVNSGLTGPGVAKSFAPASIGAGGFTHLTVTLSNSNPSAITGVAVSDNFPAGMTIASPANASNSCGGSLQATPGAATLAISGASIAANASCTFAADVTVASTGSFTNTIPAGAVTSANAGVSSAASQSLTVTQPPTVSKAFTPATITANTKTTLSITLANPTASAMSAATFIDTLPTTGTGAPGNMTLFDNVVGNTCGGTLSDSTGAALVAGSSSVKLVGGSIAASNVCTITVNVTAPTGGTYVNTIGAGALTTSGGANTAATSASLQIATPQVSKSFAASTIAANTATAMTITLTNVTNGAINALAFTDTYPNNLVNSTTTVTNTGCGGTATASAIATNPGTLALSGGTLAAGASCTLSVNVQSALSGNYTNTLPVNSVSSSIGGNAVAASATVSVNAPSISKIFSTASVPLNGTATLTLTLSNPTAVAMTGAAFTDNLPVGLVASVAGGTCSGTKTASGGTVTLAGGTIPANGSCTVSATVTGSTVGLKVNTIAAGDLTVTGPIASANGTPSSASISVLAAPMVSKSFSASPILPMTGVSTLQIVLTNGNSVGLTGVGFTDTFPTTPGAMTLANLTNSNSCGGTLTDNAGAALTVGSTGVRLSGASIPSNGACSITVNVKTNLTGDYTNTIAASPGAGFVTSNEAGGNTVAASANLAVRLAAPTLTKSFSPSTITAGGASTLTLTISNPSTTQSIAGAALSDVFPSGMKVFSTPALSNSCGGSVSPGGVAGDGSINLSGATIPFNAGGTASCIVSVQITSNTVVAAPGVTNTTGTVTSTNAATSNTASANLIINAPPPTAPTIAEAFAPASIGSGDITTLSFTLGSSNSGALTNATFTDTLSNMSVASATIGGTCAGVTNTPALALGATALNLCVPSLPPGGCTVTLQITSSNIGVNPNSVSGVTTAQTATGAGAGPINLTVLAKPTISKAFGTPTISPGGTSTIVFTLGNSNAAALTNATFSDTLTNMSVSSTAIGGSCAGVTNTPALAVGAMGSNALQLAVPSLPSGGCTVIVTVTSSTAGANPNSVSGVATNETPSAGVGAGPVNLTVTGGAIGGTVYNDANHNSQRDGSENGTALTLYAKLIPAASPGGPAQQVVAVDPATGAYLFGTVAAGAYAVVIDTNNNAAIVAPTAPSGWTATEVPTLTRSNIVVANNPLLNLNFGLYHGTPVAGVVFVDNGNGGGIANDGSRNGGEAGLGGVGVRITDNAGTTLFDSTSTDAAGNYLVYVPASANGSTIKVLVSDPSGYLNTGASVGNTGGTYNRSAGAVSFGFTNGSSYSGVNFGAVPGNLLTPNGAQSAQPGTTVFFPHTFQAGSAGQVTFTLANASSPANPGWAQTLYQDADCSATLTAAQPLVTAPFSATAGQKICLLVKQSVPAGSTGGAQNTATLTAAFAYANATPALNLVQNSTDVTTVTQSNALTLSKMINNLTQGGIAVTSTNASPADLLQYTLTAINNGTQALATLVINDVTPAFTTFLSAACPASLPPGTTACTVTAQPAVGNGGPLQWTFSGTLAPGAQLVVSYRVKVDQ